jgi:5'-3' exonuclease
MRRMGLNVHLVDGTYELFRYHYSPANKDPLRGATRGVVGSCLMLLEQGATHVAVATDHVIESFRNDLWAGYKDGSGVERDLKAQFPVVEDALRAAGFTVWAMVEQEADDALAAGAKVAAADDAVERVVICTPDKDLGQCVGGKVWQWDRRQDKWFDPAGVHARLGVPPESIPDLLALVGDAADGFPGLPGWGAKSAAAILDRWGHLEGIPLDPLTWDAGVRSAAKLNATLREQYELALLFRRIATVETDAEVGTVESWRWTGPADGFAAVAAALGDDRLATRAQKLAEADRGA